MQIEGDEIVSVHIRHSCDLLTSSTSGKVGRKGEKATASSYRNWSARYLHLINLFSPPFWPSAPRPRVSDTPPTLIKKSCT